MKLPIIIEITTENFYDVQLEIEKKNKEGYSILNVSKYSTYDKESHKPIRIWYSIFMVYKSEI